MNIESREQIFIIFGPKVIWALETYAINIINKYMRNDGSVQEFDQNDRWSTGKYEHRKLDSFEIRIETTEERE